MVTGVCVEEAQRIVSCSGVDNLIDAGEGEGILRASLIEVFKIDAQLSGFVLLWYHHHVC